MDKQVRVRFAPSPTGYLHVGGARTALFNYLFARHQGGTFILRIEDTDRKRFQPDALAEIFASLRWLGLSWDEGPEIGGEYGPYVQSERMNLYQELVSKLLDQGQAYRCFCTAERLDNMRQEQEKNKMQQGSGYDRHCRGLSVDQVNDLLRQNIPHVIRLKIPLTGKVQFTDLIRGPIEYQCELLDDIVLLKSDGFPTYHLANVIDDHNMEISHVMRGDEWIASTPRHIILYEAFGWEPPIFAHMPVILAEGGGKLSKRKGAASVLDYQKAGYLPEALINFLALLGWAPGEDRELMDHDEMIAAFSLEKVSAKAAVFDQNKLDWMNGHYLRQKNTAELLGLVKPLWREADVFSGHPEPADSYCLSVIELFKERAKKIPDIAENSRYFFQDPAEYEAKAARKYFREDAGLILSDLLKLAESLEDFSAARLEAIYREYADKKEISAGKLIHPTRLAVSGIDFGPGLFDMLALLGRETVCRRIALALRWMEKNQGDTHGRE